MKTFFRATGKELSYGVRSIRFWVAAIALGVVILMDAYWIGSVLSDVDVISITDQILTGGSYMFWVRFCLCVIPFGCCYYDEYANQASKYRLTRAGRVTYGLSKVMAGMLLTLGIVIVANLLACGVMIACGIPFVLPREYSEYTGELISYNYQYFWLLGHDHPILLYMVQVLFSAQAGICFCSLTILLSTFIKNKFILLAMPLTVFFGLDSFLSIWFYPETGPEWLELRLMFNALTRYGWETELQGLGVTVLYTLVLSAVFAAVFILRLRRVTEKE
ncbi:MAG: hypothetical protein LUE29_14045 [Lachnospiraceae bacterium]|nr:hypothetical protein [Lachnospiraceae bacterium]